MTLTNLTQSALVRVWVNGQGKKARTINLKLLKFNLEP